MNKLRKRREIKWFLLFTVPGLVVYTVFLMVPIVMSVAISLTDWTGMSKLSEASFVGLKNYRNLFSDSILRITIHNTFVYGVIVMLFVPVIGFILAYIIETFTRRKSLWRMVAYLPAMIPLIVTVFLWKWIYNPQYGLLNQFLKLIGLGKYTTGWITNSSTAFYSLPCRTAVGAKRNGRGSCFGRGWTYAGDPLCCSAEPEACDDHYLCAAVYRCVSCL